MDGVLVDTILNAVAGGFILGLVLALMSWLVRL